MLLRVSEIKIKYAQENPVETNGYHSVLGGFPAHLPLTLGPLQPNISMHILHTVLYTFLKVLTRRICLTIKSFFSW